MRIERGDTIGEQPAKAVRDCLRRFVDIIRVEGVAEVLKVSIPAARKVVSALHKLSYLEPAPHWKGAWQLTRAGVRFKAASAKPPLRRERASALLSEVVSRAQGANEHPEFTYWVERVWVFGSYLEKKEMLGDLDILVELADKEPTRAQQIRRDKERFYALQRSPRNILEVLGWAQQEVYRFVRGRSGHVAVASVEVIRQLNPKRQLVFERVGAVSLGSHARAKARPSGRF